MLFVSLVTTFLVGGRCHVEVMRLVCGDEFFEDDVVFRSCMHVVCLPSCCVVEEGGHVEVTRWVCGDEFMMVNDRVGNCALTDRSRSSLPE